MDPEITSLLTEHKNLTRRFFMRLGAAGIAAMHSLPVFAGEKERHPALQEKINELESWLTRQNRFRDVSRGNPRPHSLDEKKRSEVGLTRDTWSLEVLSDPDDNSSMRRELSRKTKTAFTFKHLMDLAKKHTVRFPKIMTCLNIGCPLGNGIWEGVPLREVLWLTQPGRKLRRVFYHGYHNDDPDQMFRSSLPVGRVLEDYFGLPPVILCYKLNGQWLEPKRGAPVRVVVPEAYGFKNIKWLSHMYLTNNWQANDTYGDQNNDVDSPLKTFCDPFPLPPTFKPGQPIPVTGYAQVGISGLKKVQAWIHKDSEKLPADDEHFLKAPWRDAAILPPPGNWGGDLKDNRIPSPTYGFDPKTGKPESWPMKLTRAHWAMLFPGLPAGKYTLRCRTIDENGAAQPMPRPFRKSGRAAIGEMSLVVEG